jgi:hypothetical protein
MDRGQQRYTFGKHYIVLRNHYTTYSRYENEGKHSQPNHFASCAMAMYNVANCCKKSQGWAFRGWQHYLEDLHLGQTKLRVLCEQVGGVDEQICFEKWRLRESKTRLWRYQRRHLQKRGNNFCKIAFWKLWLLNGLGKEDMDKKAQHAVRMGHTRLKHNTIKVAFAVLSAYSIYMQAKKRKMVQVHLCNNRRKMRLAWSIWHRLIIAARNFAVLRVRHLARFKRRMLKLFYKKIHLRVSRMLFGAWCGECKRPFDKKQLKDYAENPENLELRLNEEEQGRVALKRHRHHVRRLIHDISKDSGAGEGGDADKVNDTYGTLRKRLQGGQQEAWSTREQGLVAEYLREISQAKVLLAPHTSEVHMNASFAHIARARSLDVSR